MTTNLNLIIEQHGNVTKLILNRPNVHNAFDDTLIDELLTALISIEADENCRAVILTGNGKSFSAGADLNWMQRMANYSKAENLQDSLQLAKLMQHLNQCSKPTIAAVNGAAFGGAVGLVACCDIAIAHDQASFCLSEVKLGLIPAVISPYVIKAIGERMARRYFLTAERFVAAKALALGLIHEIADASNLQLMAMDIAEKISTNGPQAVSEAKKLIHAVAIATDEAILIQKTAEWIAEIRVSDEGQNGLNAFLQKQTPSWIKHV